MKESNKDFLLFYDWFKIYEQMPAKYAHKLLCAMVHYQIDGTEPPEFACEINYAAQLIFDQLRRRKEFSIRGKKARATQLARMSASAEAEGSAGGYAEGYAEGSSVGSPTLEPRAQDKDKDKDKDKTKTKQNSFTPSCEGVKECAAEAAHSAQAREAPRREGADAPGHSFTHSGRREAENLRLENEAILDEFFSSVIDAKTNDGG